METIVRRVCNHIPTHSEMGTRDLGLINNLYLVFLFISTKKMSDELNSFPSLIIMSNHMHLLQAATDD